MRDQRIPGERVEWTIPSREVYSASCSPGGSVARLASSRMPACRDRHLRPSPSISPLDDVRRWRLVPTVAVSTGTSRSLCASGDCACQAHAIALAWIVFNRKKTHDGNSMGPTCGPDDVAKWRHRALQHDRKGAILAAPQVADFRWRAPGGAHESRVCDGLHEPCRGCAPRFSRCREVCGLHSRQSGVDPSVAETRPWHLCSAEGP